MGVLLYGTGMTRFEFDDRVLIHLQLVITAKLRRDERFMCTWTLPVDTGGGRVSIWFDPNIPVCFQYSKVAVGPVNAVWLEELMRCANSVGGLHVLPEPLAAPTQQLAEAGAG
ncbi:DUF7882 family protein [Marisediminicola antarctica]|uniref:DUF7882 domain-containing protein n=1 Tax=Marisediminicola antarctica TaxID=674079 RepID=A0A7L5APJ1_9MICO|nr:hypothetical protein [Marisediminicola antarctica]QHO70269.1 hypothetical protein BHD05_12060 [Marisediminicola antarctica]